jgi:hypothetical protein
MAVQPDYTLDLLPRTASGMDALKAVRRKYEISFDGRFDMDDQGNIVYVVDVAQARSNRHARIVAEYNRPTDKSLPEWVAEVIDEALTGFKWASQ